MSLLGDIFGFVFGGESKGADWDQIARLMEMSTDLNRYNQNGIFTSTQWTEGPNGQWTQSQTVNPLLEGAMSNFMTRLNSSPTEYSSPSQFSQLLDAKMANQMQRHGIVDPAYNIPAQPTPGPTVQEQQAMAEEQRRQEEEAARQKAEEELRKQQEQAQQLQQDNNYDRNRFFRQQSGGGYDPMTGAPRRIN